jgi:Fibronectin-III type domain
VVQTSQTAKKAQILKHPAPPPAQHYQISDPSWKAVPPQPIVRIKKLPTGIVISWTMPNLLTEYADIACYQLYAYEETHNMPTTDNWRYVGDVKAMLLPIAVTLVQFQEGQRYHFVVRAVDKHNRVGIFSEPQTWKDPSA